MKRSMKIMLVATGLCLLVMISTATAQVNPLDTLDLRLKSPERAQGLSATSTLAPVAAGILWWVFDEPEEVQDYDHYGRLRGSYTKEPDRTGPAVLIISGIMVGPSVGYIYGDCAERGVRGLMMRTGIAALTMAAGGFAAGRGSDAPMSYDGMAAGLAVAAVGFGMITIHSLYDIGKVRSTVENRNRKLTEQRDQTSVTFAPAYFADSGAAGMQLRVKF